MCFRIAMALALFDLDNTLIAGDSDYSWGEFLVKKKLVDVEAYQRRNRQFYLDYQQGKLNVHEYLHFVAEAVSNFSEQQLETLMAEFMGTMIKPMMLDKAQKLLEHHQMQADIVVIISATSDFIVAPIVKAYGVEHFIAAIPPYNASDLGQPCMGSAKVSRLQLWLQEMGYPLNKERIDKACFYSDSIVDLPLLEVVAKPVVVDADARLLEVAKQRNWEQLSLR